MYKCKVCGKEFELKKENRYITIDIQSGLVAAFSVTQNPMYDTFDCPFCGCQNVVNSRKKEYVPDIIVEDVEIEQIDEEDKEENKKPECFGTYYSNQCKELNDWPCDLRDECEKQSVKNDEQ